MKWNYYEFLEQPEWFTDTLFMMMSVEGENARKQQEEAERKG